jgi:PleD family two-component response regulator
MTADEVDQDTVAKYFKKGADDIITRPFAKSTVMQKVQKLPTVKRPAVLIVDDE